MAIIERRIFVEGIGRVHALGPVDGKPEHFGVDDELGVRAAMRAADIILGIAKGRILWSVRFKERTSSAPLPALGLGV